VDGKWFLFLTHRGTWGGECGGVKGVDGTPWVFDMLRYFEEISP